MMLGDYSRITRLGLSHKLSHGSELRGLWSQQQTDQSNLFVGTGLWMLGTNIQSPVNSSAHSMELQYRNSGTGYTTQWGVQDMHSRLVSIPMIVDSKMIAQQLYVAWQQTLSPSWQLDMGMGWGKFDSQN